MSGWSLVWKNGYPAALSGLIDGAMLRPDRLAGLSRAELARERLTAGRQSLPLEDAFDIVPLEGEAVLRVGGSSRFIRIAAGMTAGRLEVDGDAGDLAGQEMAGGLLEVRGNAGRLAGAGMRGGLLRIGGDAGDLLAGPPPGARFGLSGGEVLVAGSAGREAGLSQRRGLIAIAGTAGERPGHHLAAGTLLVARGNLIEPGLAMRRGSIVGLDSNAPLPTGFARDGPARHLWLELLWRRLRDLGFPPAAARNELPPLESWSGDPLSLGRGEVLVPITHARA